MSKPPTKKPNLIYRIGRRLANELIGEVPEDVERCELVCRKATCSPEEWEHCENRQPNVPQAKEHDVKTEELAVPNETDGAQKP